jgi:hypothetical protein
MNKVLALKFKFTTNHVSKQKLGYIVCRMTVRSFSDSVTYSGGQAIQGQGGFYGSGGSRVSSAPSHHPEAMARQTDIIDLVQIMNEVENLESELRNLGNVVNTRSIEIKARMKKTVSNPRVRELLNRLEIKGEPVWGLSSKERDLVRLARDKYMAS